MNLHLNNKGGNMRMQKRDYHFKSDSAYNEGKRAKIMIAIGMALVIALYFIFK
ncbi:hypothetical protein HMPREF0766_12829 [Sphingobacterium spiritivorum ATCC 33861]|uniref:Uncharacterized protein n=1 Tax=Sphingobacterium spiritivorum ATCC 33861 TaxID=525373 RepID=D7VPA9_SPHSI|nr:hypothetical protein HMPREF0766_12829 [Sphingobacterium spiritivorum ATCC 33861]